MGVIAMRECQPFDRRFVGLNRVNLVSAINQAREHDYVAARRPQREIVILRRQRADCFCFQIHDKHAVTVFLE